MKTNNLEIKQYQSVEEAPKFEAPEFKDASIDHVNVVRKGTIENKATVDIIFVDDSGQKYVTMITAKLITALAKFIGEPL